MRLNKITQKIFSLGIGASLLGATLTGAGAAVDLKDYPEIFINRDNGAFNAMLVVGDEVSSSDVIGAVEVATSLQYAARIPKTITTKSGSGISMTGDAKKIEESTNNLEFNENLTSVRSSIISGDLVSLADGSIDNEYGKFGYKQTIDVPRARVIFAKDTSNAAELHDDDVALDYLLVPEGSEAYRLKITFSPALKSDHNTGGGGYLEDIRSKKITMLGKQYSILKASHQATNSISLTLMAGAISDMLNEGETKTYTIEGKQYEVRLDFIGVTEAKFTVNGQTTDALEESETFRLADGTDIGVVDIMSQEFSGGTRKVEFNLGANRIVLADTNTVSSGNGGTVTIGTEDSSNVKVDIKTSGDGGTSSGSDISISSIEIYYTPSESLYIAKGESASRVANIVEGEQGVFFLDGFDIKYEGLSLDNPEEIKIRSASNNDYKLEFTSKSGISYNVPLWAQATASSNITIGDNVGNSVRALNIFENQSISDEEYFLVNRNKYSRILQFKDVDPGSNNTDSGTGDGSGKIRIRDSGSGDVFDVTYSSLQGEMVLDGNSYKVNVSADSSSALLFVDLDGSGNNPALGTAVVNQIYTKNEGLLQLGVANSSSTIRVPGPGTYVTSGITELGYNMSYAVFTSEDDEDNLGTGITLVFGRNGDNELDISRIEGTDISSNRVGTTYTYEDYVYNETVTDSGNEGMPAYGFKLLWDQKGSGSDQDDVTITYPDSQARANVFITSGNVSAYETTVGEGVITYYETTPIQVGSAVLASEAGDVKTKNVILVGGPCANAASAAIMGNPEPCTSGFEQGSGMIRLYENNGKLALLVAGYDASDTRRAARVLAMHERYAAQLRGSSVRVSGSSFTDISVSSANQTIGKNSTINQTA